MGNKSLNGRENNVLLRNEGGETPTFRDHAYVSGADRIEDGRGLAVVDVNSDGNLDIIVQSVEKQSVLLVNHGSAGSEGPRRPAPHWLQVRLRGTVSNRDAIGARIVVRTADAIQTREVTTTGGYISGRSLLSHFGLGPHDRVDTLEVHWPRGAVTVLHAVSVDRMLIISEPTRALTTSPDNPVPAAAPHATR